MNLRELDAVKGHRIGLAMDIDAQNNKRRACKVGKAKRIRAFRLPNNLE
jgi:hypothetical protein